MNTEKILKKIIAKSEEIDKIDILSDSLTDVSIEDFYNAKTPIFFNNNVFYRETAKKSGEWIKLSLNKGLQPIGAEKSVEPNKTTNNEENLLKRVETLEKWAYQLGEWLRTEMPKISQKQEQLGSDFEEALKETKLYVDNLAKAKKEKK